MAKKNDWIHLDKTSGTGPAEVKVTADINKTGEIRQVTYKVIKEGTKEEKTFVCRQESTPMSFRPFFSTMRVSSASLRRAAAI